jgi:predicted esterase
VNDARALARMLHDVKWPARVEEDPVGHAIPDATLDRAIAWLRQRKRKP